MHFVMKSKYTLADIFQNYHRKYISFYNISTTYFDLLLSIWRAVNFASPFITGVTILYFHNTSSLKKRAVRLS